MRRHLLCLQLVLAGLILGFAGCGGGHKKPVPTEVLVLLDGKPFDGATVTFVPDNPAESVSASGLTGPDGVAKLTTNNTGDGAIPGSYKVVVTKSEVIEGTEEVGAGADPSEAIKKGMQKFINTTVKDRRGGKTHTSAAKKMVAEIYKDPKQTPFKATVPVPDGRLKLEMLSPKAK